MFGFMKLLLLSGLLSCACSRVLMEKNAANRVEERYGGMWKREELPERSQKIRLTFAIKQQHFDVIDKTLMQVIIEYL